MSSRGVFPALVGVLAIGTGATALAAAPKAGKTYSGKGQEYFNNGPHWETSKNLTEHMSFRVSANGKDVLRFRGRYSYYCGAGMGTLTAGKVAIHKKGTFSGTGHTLARFMGKVTGTDYFALKGQFIKGGKARVSYLFNFVDKGVHVSNPYSFKFRTGSCISRVTGTI